jgi:hypothetical protein
MNAALTARLIAGGRIGFGVALVLAPDKVTTRWLGDDAGRAGTAVVSRGLGARDVALGAGALVASADRLRPWVAAAILADTADLVSTLTAGRALPLTGRLLVGALASGGVVLGAIALAGLGSQPSAD